MAVELDHRIRQELQVSPDLARLIAGACIADLAEDLLGLLDGGLAQEGVAEVEDGRAGDWVEVEL
jgi:hypothetical protein